MKPTTVVSVRGKTPASLLDFDFVYVGRRCGAWPGSKWGNPFEVDRDIPGQETAAGVVALFEAHLRASIEYRATEPYIPSFAARFDQMAREVASLRGRTLGCWCCDWDGTGEPSKPCHAVVLARIADAAGGFH